MNPTAPIAQGLTMGDLARRTGLTSATLRAGETRYGFRNRRASTADTVATTSTPSHWFSLCYASAAAASTAAATLTSPASTGQAAGDTPTRTQSCSSPP